MKFIITKNRILYLTFFLILLSGCRTENKLIHLQKAGTQPDGSILVPSNQLLRPAGYQIYLAGRPVDLALTPDENYLLVKNKEDLDLIRLNNNTLIQTLPFEKDEASFTGLCLSPDGNRVLLTNSTDRICIAEFNQDKLLQWEKPILLPYPKHGQPVPGGLCFNDKGNKIFVTLTRNNSLGVINLDDHSLIQIQVGAAPYTVVCASETKAYVSNWGGRLPSEGESTYNSSGTQILVDPETGIANNGSVSVIDLTRNTQSKNIELGLHPCAMVLSPERDRLFVACANSDIISVINTSTDEVIENISVHAEENTPFGSSPNYLAISPDGKFLYVANGTDNAICVIQTGTPAKVLGYIPTGWYPGSVILNKTGKILYVANIKGIGSRYQRSDHVAFNSLDHVGSVSIISVPGKYELKKMKETVDLNNSWAGKMRKFYKSAGIEEKVPVPVVPGQASLFKHVVYIIKENRTYDQVFSDLPRGNGDTSLLVFGREVTPNHHLLAETFVLLDNFYCSGVLSADGHQWTDEAYVTDYIEKSFGGFPRSYPYDGDDALAYASSGFIWDNVLRHGLTFRNYGEFVAPEIDPPDATFSEIYRDFIEGTNKVKIHAKANLEQLEPYLCPTFIGFPNTVPDIYRAAEFIKELKEFEKNGNFPNFIIMELPNDHTSGTKPGMPTPRSAVADNDLALGQIVEAISSSKFWKETCILVTEDDPQDGLDHVDGHRTVGLVISPYTRRGEVISTYYSQVSMVRTIEDILGLPPMNRLDLSAEAMVDCFTSTPDFTPYKAVKNNIPLDEINPPLSSLTGDQLYWAKKSLEQDLDDVDRIDEDIFNRIIWHAVKGYDRPYPEFAGKQID
jgi:YVTN family beta-propeller protein